jgi:hypothetical protein
VKSRRAPRRRAAAAWRHRRPRGTARRAAVVRQAQVDVGARQRERTQPFLDVPSSVRSARRNLRRAGTLKNRSRTRRRCRADAGAAAVRPLRPPSTSRRVPCVAPDRARGQREAADRGDRRQAPRHGSRAWRPARGPSSEAILLVAWRETASAMSAPSMPPPSSRTRTRRMPPPQARSRSGARRRRGRSRPVP